MMTTIWNTRVIWPQTFALLVALMLASGLMAETTRPGAVSSTQLLTVSGIDYAIEQFPELMLEGIDQDPQLAEQENITELKQIIRASVDVAAMKADLARHLDEVLSEAERAAVLEWYLSPLGQKIVALEKKAADPKNMRQANDNALNLQRQYRGQPREKLFIRYDRATEASESTLEIAMNIQKALVGAFAGKDASQAEREQLMEMVEANRFTLRGLIGQQVYTSYLYTYQPLSDEELRRYIEFAESPVGHRFYEQVNEGMRHILKEPARAIGEKILGQRGM